MYPVGISTDGTTTTEEYVKISTTRIVTTNSAAVFSVFALTHKETFDFRQNDPDRRRKRNRNTSTVSPDFVEVFNPRNFTGFPTVATGSTATIVDLEVRVANEDVVYWTMQAVTLLFAIIG